VDKFEMYIQIRGMVNQRYSVSAIARKLELSRNTAYKYLKKSPDEMAEWTASTMIRTKKLDIHKELILKWLREYPDISAAQVNDWLKEKFPTFKVGESTVRNYVKELREEFSISLRWFYAGRQILKVKEGSKMPWGSSRKTL
jgi:transposase